MTELVYGCLQWQSLLDWHLEAALSRGVVKTDKRIVALLRLASYELFFCDSIPPHATINEMVELCKALLSKKPAGLVNAVLRKLSRTGKKTPTDLHVRVSHPRWLVELWRSQLGDETLEEALLANNKQPPLTIRAVRGNRDQLQERLQDEGFESQPCRYSVHGLTLERGEGAFESASFADGLWVVQDEAAQLCSLILSPQPGEQVAEFGCGLGGKTMHLAMLMQDSGRLLAIDRHRGRLSRLQEVLTKTGFSSVSVLERDLSAQSVENVDGMDRVLIDAPCSGLGILRRQPEIRWRRTSKDIARLAKTQWAMIEAAVRALKPGGKLLYAVCTVSDKEGPAQIERLREEHRFTLERPTGFDKLCDTDGSVRLWPHCHNTDGFYIALLKKPG